MEKQETLAQLICRTVFEFEQRQAAQLLQESHLEDDVPGSNLPKANQPLSKNKSESKGFNRKKKTA
jgi:hypothetical protein